MKMMYEIIAQELHYANIENAHPQYANIENAHPQDYLNFYCLGNRENNNDNEPDAVAQPSNSGTIVVIMLL